MIDDLQHKYGCPLAVLHLEYRFFDGNGNRQYRVRCSGCNAFILLNAEQAKIWNQHGSLVQFPVQTKLSGITM